MTDQTDSAPEDAWEREYESAMLAAVQALDPRWSVRGYSALRMSDGVAFTFVLLDGQEEVAFVEDSGVGGGPFASFIPTARASREAWEAEAARLFPADTMAGESLIEALLRKAGK